MLMRRGGSNVTCTSSRQIQPQEDRRWHAIIRGKLLGNRRQQTESILDTLRKCGAHIDSYHGVLWRRVMQYLRLQHL
jgi:hypothetical protein